MAEKGHRRERENEAPPKRNNKVWEQVPAVLLFSHDYLSHDTSDPPNNYGYMLLWTEEDHMTLVDSDSQEEVEHEVSNEEEGEIKESHKMFSKGNY